MTIEELKKLHYEVKPCKEEELELIENKLEEAESTCLTTASWDSDQDRVLKITDREGNLIAGIVAVIHGWGTAELDLLWVDERYRGRGMASALIREAEAFFRESGCSLAVVDTFDYQARPLYEKHGYSLCGTVEDFPKGHCRYYLKKCLDSSDPDRTFSNAWRETGFKIQPGDGQDADLIFDGIMRYDVAQVQRPFEIEGEDGFYQLNKVITGPEGKLIAGCYAAVTGWGNLFLGIWVEETFRNRGIGSCLLREVEREAKQYGAYVALLDNVYDWQAEFLHKNGYRTSHRHEGGPRGRRLMQKEL